MFHGLKDASLQAALNQTVQLKALLSSNPKLALVRDPDGDRLPIHWAAARGFTKAIQLLLQAGADPAALDKEGRSAPQLAEALGQGEAAELLAGGVIDESSASGRRASK